MILKCGKGKDIRTEHGGDSRAALRPGNFNHEVKISIYVAGFHLEAKNTLRYFKAGKKELG